MCTAISQSMHSHRNKLHCAACAFDADQWITRWRVSESRTDPAGFIWRGNDLREPPACTNRVPIP
jgi:hypothetical protein